MKTKTQLFNELIEGKQSEDRILFRPILMHFAARFAGKTYGQFASDHKVLVECNIKAMEHFDLDLVGLISDPYRETSALRWIRMNVVVSVFREMADYCAGGLVFLNHTESIREIRVVQRPLTLALNVLVIGEELFRKVR